MIEQMITSSALILSVCAIRTVFEMKISPRIKYALWLLVAVKLLVPIPDFETKLSILNVAGIIGQGSQETGFTVGFTENPDNQGEGSFNDFPKGEAKLSQAATGNAANGNPGISQNDLPVVAAAVWKLGIAGFSLAFLLGNLVFSWNLRKKRKFTSQYRELKVYEIDEPVSPCLYGVCKPVIYVSKRVCQENEKTDYILLHEYTHDKHGDHLWALIRCICVILYWYHPLVWLAAKLSVKDGELACDAGVVRAIGGKNRIAYGRILVDALNIIREIPKRGNPLGLSTSMTGGAKDMKKRMAMIANRPQTKATSLVFIMALCLGLIGCTFGNAVSGEEMYGEIVADLGDEDAYAFLAMDYGYPVMVTTHITYDEGSEEQAAVYGDVYYYVDDEAKNLGRVGSDGTAYPVKFSKDGIFVAGGHWMEKYSISGEGELSLAKGIYETFDRSGNATYTCVAEETEAGITTETEITEDEFREMVKEYSESQIVHFSYGAEGSVNELSDTEETSSALGN